MSVRVHSSRLAFEDAVDVLKTALSDRGIPVFATIDHAAAARGAGLEMQDETVIIFGNPSVGTALMLADPTVGLNLPLRVLIWSEGAQTKVAYQDPRSYASEFTLDTQVAVLERLAMLLAELVTDIVSPTA